MATTLRDSETRELDAPSVVLARAGELRRAADAAEAAILVSAAEWADLHPVLPRPDGSWPTGALDDEDLPDLAWDAPAALAAALGMSTDSGTRLIHDALQLRHRLPRIWARLLAGGLPAWRSRRIAQAAHGTPSDVAAHLDDHLVDVAHRVGVVVLDRLVDEACCGCTRWSGSSSSSNASTPAMSTCTPTSPATPAWSTSPFGPISRTRTTSTPRSPRSPPRWRPVAARSHSMYAGRWRSASSLTHRLPSVS